jgi:hypothetical protein
MGQSVCKFEKFGAISIVLNRQQQRAGVISVGQANKGDSGDILID